MSIIKTIEDVIDSPKNPNNFLNYLPRIESEFTTLRNLLEGNNPPFIYGVNSLVGHLDKQQLTPAEINSFQNELLENHAIDLGFGYYNKWQVQCIFYAKLKNITSGGTAISPNLFNELVNIYTNDNYDLKIPIKSSYSCGDVIPAANFTRELTQYFENNLTFVYKDVISLINGNYISTGLSLSLLPRLLNVLDHLIENTILIFEQFDIDYKILEIDSEANPLLNGIYTTIKNNTTVKEMNSQPSVSLRSAFKNIDLLYNTILDLNNIIVELLKKPSDNPLISTDGDILSNSSFYSPQLALKLSAIIDSILFNSWNIERRVHFILSGEIKGTTQNFSTSDNRLGLIQIPKMITNMLQNIRLDFGTRPFNSGLETSYGIEDSWTCAEKLVQQIIALCEQFDTMLKIEKLIINYPQNSNYQQFKNDLHKTSIPTKVKHTYEYKYVCNI
ncbi:TPA: aromatic amino acid lyase [Streptococcus suis]